MSKILANRLSLKIDSLLDASQSAFIKGQCIVDNIITAQETFFYMQKHHLPGLILKVDFAKAFYTVDWCFILELLKARGFSDKWIGWINAILTSSKAKFLINGNQSGYISYRRGLKQGDPLSVLSALSSRWMSWALCLTMHLGLVFFMEYPWVILEWKCANFNLLMTC